MFRLSLLCLSLALAGCSNSTFNATPATPVASTALPTVTVLPTLLDMPGLNRQRQVRLYLPPDYATSGKRYPVLYMHDGQNLFDRATAYAGEWQVDETLGELSKEKSLDMIVVGIDNGQANRMTELNAWPHKETGAPEGKEYMDFIVKVVKPMIDREYRTLPNRANTAIMGSSMGGLISHYAINQYPDVFSKAGVFSPSYWAGGPTPDYIASKPLAADARVYMLVGQKEGGQMVGDAEKAYALAKAGGHPAANISLKVVPGGEHSEAFWAGEFREAVLWMFAPAAGAASTAAAQ